MAALAAAIQMTAQGSSAAVLNGEKHAEMEPGQPDPSLLDETVAMRPDDIGHLERWRLHLLYSLRDRFTWSRLVSSAWSSGVPADLRWRSERCREMDVGLRSACPSSACKVGRSAPPSRRCVAKLCRSRCGRTALVMPARRAASRQASHRTLGVIGLSAREPLTVPGNR